MDKQLILTSEEAELNQKRYKQLDDMQAMKDKEMPHFSGDDGMRSFLTQIDYNERLLNGYTPSRDEQGKEEWQSNFMDKSSRMKLRAIAAGVGLKVPEMEYVATNKDGILSYARAEMMKNTVRSSFLDGNPTMNAFLEVWRMLAHGVVFEHEGYQSGGAFREVVDYFDMRTGEVKTKREYVAIDGKPFSLILNPQEFFWADWFRMDLQAQPYIAWTQRYSRNELELEFSKYPNYKHVLDKKSSLGTMMRETTYFRSWSDRIGEVDDYDVFRFYSKEEDRYEIRINGIPMLGTPLLWGKSEKWYPFSKTIGEPFANPEFMVGMALPQILEGYQDSKTTTNNMVIDKLYRSLVPPFLVGLANKDLLEVEQELVNQDDRIYVPDVNQVKPFPFESVNQSDLAMLSMFDRSIDMLSVDASQQGQQIQDVTARGAIIADERARELKGITYMFLEDLHLQKNRLRVQTVLTHWIKDKGSRTGFKDSIISVPNVTFSDGAIGTLDIHVAKNKRQLLSETEIEAREQAAAEQGIVYKLVSFTDDYLDDWIYDFKVIPSSLYNQNRIRKEADTMEKIQREVSLFPEQFIANKPKRYRELMDIYGDVTDYQEPQPAPTLPLGQEEEEPAPVGPAMPSPLSEGAALLQ